MLLRSLVLLALTNLSACGAEERSLRTSSGATSASQATTSSGPSGATAVPGATADAAGERASEIVLTAQGLKLALPPGWSQRRDGSVVIALSPSKKSGMFVYGTKLSAFEETTRVLHLFDETFGVTVEVELGEKWLAKSGLRYSRNEKALTTKQGERATSITLLGAAPADRESAAGVMAIAVEGDDDARAAIEAALETLAPL